MALEKLKKKTILRLKEIKDEQELSISQIMDLLEQRGAFVSESTLKKVFAEGSEDKNFRYQDSIVPIADVLLDIYGDKSGIVDTDSLKQIIREKNKYIEFLVIKLEELGDESKGREKLYEDRKAAFEKTITSQETQIQRLNAQIERKDEMIKSLLDAVLSKKE